jgi:ABC-type antimicrobial peptide transport system permease subunit
VLLLGGLRHSARSFARTPVITVALVITIAVGVGSNAVVHGFIRGLITRDLPVNTDRVYSLFGRGADGGAAPLSLEDLAWLERHVTGFAWLGAVRELQANVELADRQDVLSAAAVTAPVASLLGLPLGNGVVLSHAVWQDAFQGKVAVRGERVRIDGRDMRVSGVAPAWLEGLFLGRDVDLWMPLENHGSGIDTTSATLWIFGRLGDGVSAQRTAAAARARHADLGGIAMLPYTGVTPEMAVGLTRVHGLLVLAAGAVFLIACANVASFLLARASARSRETSVRVALGASRRQLVGQLLADSVVIATAGGAFGILLAIWTSRLVPALLFASDAGQLRFVPDRWSVAMSAGVCAVVTVACGLAPLLEVRYDRPAVVLRREAMGPSPIATRLRAGLVVAEMAACCLLVIATGLLLQSFQHAVATSAGRKFSRSILATVQSASTESLDYFQVVEKATQQMMPGATTAWVARAPGNRPTWRSFRAEPPNLALRDDTMDVAAFTPETLERIVLPPVAGRLFGARDGPLACRAAVINTVAADELFGGDAVGASVIDPVGERVEIIGVVAARPTASAAERTRPTVYYYPDQTRTPYGRTGPMPFRVPASRRLEVAVLNSNIVSRSYFAGTGSSAIAGDVFGERSPPRGCRVAVINQEAAERYYGGNAIGGAVIDALGRRTEIVGVVSSPSLGRFDRRTEPSILFPMRQDFVARMTLMVDGGDSGDPVVDTLRQRLESVPGSAGVPVVVERLEDHLARTALAPLHIAALLVRASAAMALVLAVAGVYGALTDAAQRRRREIGLRIALGAQPWRVVALILGEGAQLAALGAGVGIVVAVAARRKLAGVAPGAESLTVAAWLAGPVLLLAVVVVASVIPALRAVLVNPVTVLKDEG